ncbi:MAG: OmpH family outer membrane protein [Candidatus Kapaibacterium sp.]|nr:OmpH family outer membrane protein [Ignavibacteriota bacterium]MCB9220571.1 OmpH family outer membrane protein [Ignavibacteria bacterium]
MKKLYYILFVFLFVALGFTNAQSLKVGVANLQMVVEQLPDAKKIDTEIKEIATKYQDSLLKMQGDLETKFQTYQKQKGMMTQEQQIATEQELQALNQTVLQFQQAKFGQQGELQMKRLELLQPLRNKIKDAIDKVSASEKLNLVLDSSTESVLFADDALDITFKVLDMLKRGGK